MITAGDPYIVRDTLMNKNCGLRPQQRVYITFVSEHEVSIYIDSSTTGGSVEAVLEKGLLSSCFQANPFQSNNKAYVKYCHESKRFPEDFFIK